MKPAAPGAIGTGIAHSPCGWEMIRCPRHGVVFCNHCEDCSACVREAKDQAPVPAGQLNGDPRNLYAERLAFRRADKEAQRKLAAEDQPPIRRPEVLTLRERLAREQPPIQWRIEGWQPTDSRVMLSAAFKGGKTTLIANLVRSLVDGDPFLGAHEVTTDRTVTVLDFAMSPRQLDAWYADQGIRNDDRVTVIPLRGSAAAFNILDLGIRSQWVEMLKGRACGYLIVDCLRPILDALGLSEHTDAGQFLTPLDALLMEADIPNACVVHHMGHIAERSRGDSRIRDWPDVEWRLVRESDDPASPRYVSAYGRDVDIPESLLNYDPGTRRLSIGGGSRKDAAARAALVDVLKVLTKTPKMSGRQIEDQTRDIADHAQKAIRAAVKLGVREGSIVVEEGPRRSRLHSSASVRRSASTLDDALGDECVNAYRDDALTTHSTEQVSASDPNPSTAYDKEKADAVFARLRAQRET